VHHRSANEESAVSDNASTYHIEVGVSEDRMEAWLEVRVPDCATTAPTVEQLAALVEKQKVAVTDAVRQRLDKLATLLAAALAPPEGTDPPEVPSRVPLAEGQPATDATDGVFEWSPDLEARRNPPTDDDHVDYFAMNTIVTVPAGAYLGRIIAPIAGTSGTDVLGNERAPRKPKGVPVTLGCGVQIGPPEADADGPRGAMPGSDSPPADAAEGDLIYARSDGRVVLAHGRIAVEEVLEIRGDVDFNSGSVDACVDVLVCGTVRSNFTVKTTKALSVERVIEAAEVHADQDIMVRGGIFGQECTGRVSAGGDIAAHLLNEAVVCARGDVHVKKEIINSRVTTNGQLIAERSTMIGGECHARERMTLRVVGSDAGVVTLISVGPNINELRRARQKEREIKALEKSAEQIRKTVEPLMANMKRLLPEQRERATELICKADELELSGAELRQEIERMRAAARPVGEPALTVEEVIHAGTVVTIGTRDVHFGKLLHGPVRLELRKVKNVTEVVAVNQRTGSITVLPSTEADLDAPCTDENCDSETAHGTDESHHADNQLA
jgi:uncharacterized protein (DUF342 family)